jgi:hypothetical protein
MLNQAVETGSSVGKTLGIPTEQEVFGWIFRVCERVRIGRGGETVTLEPIGSVAGGREAKAAPDDVEGVSEKGSMSLGLWEEGFSEFARGSKLDVVGETVMLEPIGSVAGCCEARAAPDEVEGISEKGSISSGLWEERDRYLRKTPKESGPMMVRPAIAGSPSPDPSSNDGSGSCSG